MTLFNSDCLEQLKKLEANSIDSLVTDPPAGISFMGKEWDSDKGGRSGWVAWMTEVMRECLRVMKPGAHGLVWAIPRTSHWTATALEDAGFEVRDVITHLFGKGFPKSLNIEKAGAGAVWSGWGTSLKPTSEHWILVRKPCEEKTVAANVLKWETGGINVDGCRIELPKNDPNVNARSGKTLNAKGIGTVYPNNLGKITGDYFNQKGRFPANLVLSHTPHCSDDQCDIECAIKALDEQASQSASRFFYCVKISTRERGEGNNHPTVKPQKLMRYFCRLITPPGGTVLDPFMGSGSTGMAARSEGFQFVGIELDPDYFQIAAKRIEAIDQRHRAI